MKNSINPLRKIITGILAILWCGVIFAMSHRPAALSQQDSDMVVDIVIDIMTAVTHTTAEDLPLEEISLISHSIRKSAHFIEYFILGGLLALFLGSFDTIRGCRDKTQKNRYRRDLFLFLFLVIASGVLYAAGDELHQYFIPGRAMMLKDLLIDTLGVITGTILTEGVGLMRDNALHREK